MKGLGDRILAATILVLILPLLLMLCALIKLDSRGPILVRQKRYGPNNKVVEVFKFRSMYIGCENATRHGPRVTRIGRMLRRTSLNELPQFLNVLKGTVSIATLLRP